MGRERALAIATSGPPNSKGLYSNKRYLLPNGVLPVAVALALHGVLLHDLGLRLNDSNVLFDRNLFPAIEDSNIDSRRCVESIGIKP